MSSIIKIRLTRVLIASAIAAASAYGITLTSGHTEALAGASRADPYVATHFAAFRVPATQGDRVAAEALAVPSEAIAALGVDPASARALHPTDAGWKAAAFAGPNRVCVASRANGQKGTAVACVTPEQATDQGVLSVSTAAPGDRASAKTTIAALLPDGPDVLHLTFDDGSSLDAKVVAGVATARSNANPVSATFDDGQGVAHRASLAGEAQ